MNELVKLSDLAASLEDNVDKSKAMDGVMFARFDSKGDGIWELNDGTELEGHYIVDLRSLLHGWMAWGEDLGMMPQKEMVSMFQGGRPPKPEQLKGYKDWTKAWGVGFISVEDAEEKIWFESNNWGWELQYQAFVLETVLPYFQANEGGGYPIVELTHTEKRDRNGNLYPLLKLVKWEAPTLLDAPEEKKKPERRRRSA